MPKKKVTETIINTPLETREPKSFVAQIFWDTRAGGYSASRVVMVGGTLVSLLVIGVVLYIVMDSYINGQPIPELSWLMIGGGGSIATSAGGYVMNQWSGSHSEYGSQITEQETI